MSFVDAIRRAAGRLSRRMRGWLSTPSAGQTAQGHAAAGWQSLAEPVPGHSTIDGVPVPVVAVRRNRELDQLEVVRGLLTSAGVVGQTPPSEIKRHIVPALSFIPHPRRELLIDGRRYFFGSVTSSTRCAVCGADPNGFAFVTSDSVSEAEADDPSRHSTLCERCAAQRAARSASTTDGS
jgi:hypothetical protein